MMEEELEEARMEMSAAAWRIVQLAGTDTLIEDLSALLHLLQTGAIGLEGSLQ
jgi:hypothetical protein